MTPGYHSEREHHPPDVNTDVFVRDDRNGEEYEGRVIAVGDDNVVVMQVIRTIRSGPKILNDQHGCFRFGKSSAAS